MSIINADSEQLHQEVLVSTDTNSQFFNVCVWDYESGSSLLTFNNCSTRSNGLSFIKKDYMLCAINNKPFIYYWNLKNRSQQFSKITCAGSVNTIDVTKCGNYIAVGIDDKVYVWQTYSGRILNTLTRHFQRVTKVVFAHNDTYLITASDDSIIFVYNLNDVLNLKNEFLEPKYTWNGHTLPIKHVYTSDVTDRVVSVSDDLSCKIWSLLSGSLVCSLTFSSVTTYCLMDHLESNLYVSFYTGSIVNVPIKSLLNESNKLINEDDHGVFLGHKKDVKCLAISLDDTKLASGSEDCTIRIWDTITRQCIKILNHNGPVTNLQFKFGSYFFNEDKSAVVPIFNRYNVDSEYNQENCINVLIKPSRRENMLQKLKMTDFVNNLDVNENNDEYFELKSKFDSVKNINEKIYNYAVNEIFK